MRRPLLIAGGVALGLLALGGAYLSLWPVPIDPVAWQAPTAPAAEGDWSANQALASVSRMEVAAGDYGPEDLHRMGDFVYGGTHHGAILRWPVAGGPPEEVANTGGRPLGLHVDPQGRLLIADAFAGLLRLEADGSLTTLCDTAADGSKLVFTDDLDVADDGTVWFSDASTRFDQTVWQNDILESRPNGRLLRWHPDRPQCEVVQDGLYFANGVALAQDASFVLLNETTRYRVRRLWLSGPREGELEVLIDNLPGFPDGISRGEDGVFWIALASPRNALVDALAGSPFLRRVVQRLPEALKPAPERHPYVVAIDADGKVLRTLQDPSGTTYGMVTSAQQHGDRLYLGSLHEPAAAWVSLTP